MLAHLKTKIQNYKYTRLLADDWDDNQRGDSGSTLASSQEGWPHPSQHQPRHIGEQLHWQITTPPYSKTIFINISLNRFEAIRKAFTFFRFRKSLSLYRGAQWPHTARSCFNLLLLHYRLLDLSTHPKVLHRWKPSADQYFLNTIKYSFTGNEGNWHKPSAGLYPRKGEYFVLVLV